MICKCNEIGPNESCMICAEKHFTAAMQAMREFGHKDKKNHSFAVGEICLAINHIQVDHPDLAEKMRTVRHLIQYRQTDQISQLWDEICMDLYDAITAEIEKKPYVIPASIIPEMKNVSYGKIYIFSNVKYPEENKITPEKNDILVFLNKATTIDYYQDHKLKVVYHRSPKEDYGKRIEGVRNAYVFNGGPVSGIPRGFIDDLKKTYDWNYEIAEGKIKCMTTGYMVAKWMQKKYPERQIILVNFGFEVQNSTYRCPYHNWKYEAEDLKNWTHIYLEEKK